MDTAQARTTHPAVSVANAHGFIVVMYRRVTAAEGDERFAVAGYHIGEDVGHIGTVDANTGELRDVKAVAELVGTTPRHRRASVQRPNSNTLAILGARLEDRQAQELAR